MATRQVTTVFAVEGEKNYKSAVSTINAELKRLNSELELLSEKYRGNENSAAALRGKTAALQAVYDKQREKLELLSKAWENTQKNMLRYQEECERLSKQIEDNRKKLDEFAKAGKETSDEAKKLAKETSDLEKSLRASSEQYQRTKRNSEGYATQANETRIEIEKLGREIDNTSEYLTEAEKSFDGYAHSLDETGKSAEEMGEKTVSNLDLIAATLASANIKEGFEDIRAVIADCIKSSMEFESAMAGVFKTVSGTPEELAKLEQGIKDLSLEIPASTEEIASVAEAAGQLGIATEDILEFTEVMVKLGTSTNLSATEAATSLARLANITEMSSDDYGRLGATIVDLGNKFATTEEEIVSLATRMASTGDMVGLSEADMLAYAAAISSVGIEAEAGGTALSKLFKQLETNVASGSIDEYAEIAGMLADEFEALWETNPAEALRRFIEGLGEIEEMGGSAIITLQDLGISEVRLSNAVLALSSSGDLLTRALETSKEAWRENTALTEEAAKRYGTTESKIKILENAVSLLKTAVGDDFVNAFSPGLDTLTDFTEKLAEMAEVSPVLSSALAGVGGSLMGLTGLGAVAAAIKGVTAAMTLLNTAFGAAAGPIGLAVTAIAGIASAVMVYHANVTALSDDVKTMVDTNDALMSSVEESKKAYASSGESVEENRLAVEKLIAKVTKLADESERTAAEQTILESAIDELNDRLPGLGLNYDAVTGQINMTRDALLKFSEQASETAKLDALESYIGDLTSQQAEIEVRMALNEDSIAEAQARYDSILKVYESQEYLLDFKYAFDGDETTKTLWQLHDDLVQAESDLKALQKSQEDMAASLTDVNRQLEAGSEKYNELADAADNAGKRTAQADNEIAAAREKLKVTLTELQDLSEQELKDLEKNQEERIAMQEEALDAYKDYLDDRQKEHDKQQKAELKAFQKNQSEQMDALNDRLDAELDAKKEAHEKSLELLNEEYMAQLKVIDEERYNRIKALQDEIDAIDAKTEAEEEALDILERQKRLDEAGRKIREADSADERIEAMEAYSELKARYDREDILKEREKHKELLEAQIDAIEEEMDVRESALKEEFENREKQLKEQYEQEEKALKESHENQRKILKEQQEIELEEFREVQEEKSEAYRKELDKQLENFKENQAAELEALKEAFELEKAELELQQAERERMAMEHTRSLIQVIEEEAAGIRDSGKKTGNDFALGLMEGIAEKSGAVWLSAEELAKLPEQAVREEQEMHSPSKVAERLGAYFGEGLAIGLAASEQEVASAASALAGKFDISGELADKFRMIQKEISSVSLTAGKEPINYDDYSSRIREMNRAAAGSAAYASGLRGQDRTANITVIQQLDGKEISREVSRVQWGNTVITARARGVR